MNLTVQPVWEPSSVVTLQVVEPGEAGARSSTEGGAQSVEPSEGGAQSVDPELEQALLDALRVPTQAGESHLASATRRELTIAGMFGRLDVITAYHLARRLDMRRPDDELAVAFYQRLAVDRRDRLRRFLDGARRRAALQR